jgi:hypothetical protein
VLDHLLAPFMFEIDVDVGRLFAFLADEAFEQQAVLGGVDGGDAKDIADGGIGRRARGPGTGSGAAFVAGESG